MHPCTEPEFEVTSHTKTNVASWLVTYLEATEKMQILCGKSILSTASLEYPSPLWNILKSYLLQLFAGLGVGSFLVSLLKWAVYIKKEILDRLLLVGLA